MLLFGGDKLWGQRKLSALEMCPGQGLVDPRPWELLLSVNRGDRDASPTL